MNPEIRAALLERRCPTGLQCWSQEACPDTACAGHPCHHPKDYADEPEPWQSVEPDPDYSPSWWAALTFVALAALAVIVTVN